MTTWKRPEVRRLLKSEKFASVSASSVDSLLLCCQGPMSALADFVGAIACCSVGGAARRLPHISAPNAIGHRPGAQDAALS